MVAGGKGAAEAPAGILASEASFLGAAGIPEEKWGHPSLEGHPSVHAALPLAASRGGLEGAAPPCVKVVPPCEGAAPPFGEVELPCADAVHPLEEELPFVEVVPPFVEVVPPFAEVGLPFAGVVHPYVVVVPPFEGVGLPSVAADHPFEEASRGLLGKRPGAPFVLETACALRSHSCKAAGALGAAFEEAAVPLEAVLAGGSKVQPALPCSVAEIKQNNF